MKKLALMAMLLATPALADDGRQNVMIKFADVLAIAGRCQTVKLNMDMLKILAIGYGIDVREGTPDAQVLEAMVLGKRTQIAGLTDDEVCAMGALGYGKHGMNMENLLLKK